MSNRLFWLVYVPAVLVGSAVFQVFDPVEPPATDLATLFFQVVGGALVFAALGWTLGFALTWYRVRPAALSTIDGDKLRRNVLWITLGILVLMILYSAGSQVTLGAGTP